jgi:syntaxin 5
VPFVRTQQQNYIARRSVPPLKTNTAPQKRHTGTTTHSGATLSGRMSSSVDRTSEFFEILSTFESTSTSSPHHPSTNNPSGGSPTNYTNGKRNVRQATPSEFSKGASDVSYRVQRTAAQLEELTRMVKSSDMFGDQTVSINRLSLSIKQEMTDLKGDLDRLSEAVGVQPRNSGGGGSGVAVHSQRMVESLKMQLGETTKDFKNALQIRATKLREQQDRRHRMGFTDASSTIIQRPLAFGPPGGSGGGGGGGGGMGGLQPLGRMGGVGGMGSGVGEMGGMVTASPLQLSEAQLVDRNLDYLESRADAVQTINQTMGELNSVFSNLLQLIDIQGQNVERIDDNVTNMADSLEAGIQELEQSVSSTGNLRLYAKMFGILMVFLIGFIVFLA